MDNHLYEIIGTYGLIAVFFLVMIEGDITLLLAGVLAHSAFFGDHSFAQVLMVGTLGGVASDTIAYLSGRGASKSARDFRFYRAARPRIERLTNKFGALSIFLSKYIYGLRWACCVFYGVGHKPFTRFLLVSFASCFAWVFILSGAGYFFSGAITKVIGDFHQIGKVLLVIVVCGVAGFYLMERYWLGKKVEEADPERIQNLEHAAQDVLHDIKEEIQERIHLPRRKDSPKQEHTRRKERGAEGD